MLGALFLAQELTNGAFDAGEFIGKAWPLLLIVVGAVLLLGAVTNRPRREAVEQPTSDGEAGELPPHAVAAQIASRQATSLFIEVSAKH